MTYSHNTKYNDIKKKKKTFYWMKHSLNFRMGTIVLCSRVSVSARALDDLHIVVKDVVLLSRWQPATVWGQVTGMVPEAWQYWAGQKYANETNNTGVVPTGVVGQHSGSGISILSKVLAFKPPIPRSYHRSVHCFRAFTQHQHGTLQE